MSDVQNMVGVMVSVFLASMFPTVTALIGILLNRRDAQELRGELSNVRERLARVETKLDLASTTAQ